MGTGTHTEPNPLDGAEKLGTGSLCRGKLRHGEGTAVGKEAMGRDRWFLHHSDPPRPLAQLPPLSPPRAQPAQCRRAPLSLCPLRGVSARPQTRRVPLPGSVLPCPPVPALQPRLSPESTAMPPSAGETPTRNSSPTRSLGSGGAPSSHPTARGREALTAKKSGRLQPPWEERGNWGFSLISCFKMRFGPRGGKGSGLQPGAVGAR